jgi:TatD DNase family protein
MFVDTHAHLYDEQFDADRDEMIQLAIDEGVTKIFMPNCDSTTITAMNAVAEKWKDNCFIMLGLHPCYVKETYKEELQIAEEHLIAAFANKQYVAGVGEIGLDYYWDLTYKTQQIEVFETQIDWALQYDLPIIIHSRESTADCINIVKRKQNGKLRGIFHCFGGTMAQAEEVAAIGLHLGIGGVVTFKNSSLQQIVKEIPLEFIVLETDAPYLAPVPYRGKRNESSHIPLVADKIADLKNIDVAEVATVTTQNAATIFRPSLTLQHEI